VLVSSLRLARRLWLRPRSVMLACCLPSGLSTKGVTPPTLKWQS
jgi:hypothetical protein